MTEAGISDVVASADRRRWLALAALALAMLTIGLDVTVLTIALPTLATDLGANSTQLQWFTAAYTLMLAATMLPAGALGDRYGRKRLLLCGLVLFGAASIVCSYAQTSGQLVGARALLGLAAGIMMPLSMSVLPTLFPDPAERARALTVWVTSTALGLPLGPILGGWLLDNFWWGSVFLINVPLVVVGAAAVAALVPESRVVATNRLDYPGALLAVVGLLGLTYGFIAVGERGWGSAAGWAAIVAGVAVLTGFAIWERHCANPLLDVSLFTDNGFRWGTVLVTLVNFAMFGLFFTVPQYFQAVLGVDALGSGIRLLPLIGGLIAGARSGDMLLRSAGARAALVVGFGLLALGLALGALTSVGSSYAFVAAWISIVGAGIGLVTPAAMGVAIDALSAERAGIGSAMIQAFRQVGGTIGVAVLGTVLATRYRTGLGTLDVEPFRAGVGTGVGAAKTLGAQAVVHVQSAFVSGMGAMLWVCAAICAVSLILAWRFTPRATLQHADRSQSVHGG